MSCAIWARRSSAPTIASNCDHFDLELLLDLLLLAFGDFLEGRVDLGALLVLELELRQPRLVVDRHGRAVVNRALDVVDVDVVAEDLLGADVGRLDGRSGEADERGIGQRVADVLGEAVADGTPRPRGLISCASKPYWLRWASSAMKTMLRRSESSGNSCRFSSGMNFWMVVKTTPPLATWSRSLRSVAAVGLLRASGAAVPARPRRRRTVDRRGRCGRSARPASGSPAPGAG